MHICDNFMHISYTTSIASHYELLIHKLKHDLYYHVYTYDWVYVCHCVHRGHWMTSWNLFSPFTLMGILGVKLRLWELCNKCFVHSVPTKALTNLCHLTTG